MPRAGVGGGARCGPEGGQGPPPGRRRRRRRYYGRMDSPPWTLWLLWLVWLLALGSLLLVVTGGG